MLIVHSCASVRHFTISSSGLRTSFLSCSQYKVFMFMCQKHLQIFAIYPESDQVSCSRDFASLSSMKIGNDFLVRRPHFRCL